MQALDLFLMFLLYSSAGWVWEVTLYAVRDHKVVNRGFLFGPLCPIYGCGAVLSVLLMYGRVTNPFLIFLLGMTVCTALEYGTHYLLEKFFHTTWWDYSKVRFNLHGRVCLPCSLAFGACITALLCVVQPLVDTLLGAIPQPVKYALAGVCYTLLVADLTLALTGLLDLNKRLKALQETIVASLQKNVDTNVEKQKLLSEQLEQRLAELSKHRLIKSFPRIRSNRYAEALRAVLEKRKTKR